jgi:hypothetical protein
MGELVVRAGFEDLGAVHAALAGFGAEKLDERFDAGGVQLRLVLPLDRAGPLRTHLRDATRDRVQVEAAGAD